MFLTNRSVGTTVSGRCFDALGVATSEGCLFMGRGMNSCRVLWCTGGGGRMPDDVTLDPKVWVVTGTGQSCRGALEQDQVPRSCVVG